MWSPVALTPVTLFQSLPSHLTGVPCFYTSQPLPPILSGVGDMAKWLRTPVVLPKTLSSLPSIHMGASQQSVTPVSGHLISPSSLLAHCIHVVHTQTSRHTYRFPTPMCLAPCRCSAWDINLTLICGEGEGGSRLWKVWQLQCDGRWVVTPLQPPQRPPSIHHNDILCEKIHSFTQDANGCPSKNAVLSTQLCLLQSTGAKGCTVVRTIILHLHHQGTQDSQMILSPRWRH